MFDKDEVIKVFKDTENLIYTAEFIEWSNTPVSDPEKWIGKVEDDN